MSILSRNHLRFYSSIANIWLCEAQLRCAAFPMLWDLSNFKQKKKWSFNSWVLRVAFCLLTFTWITIQICTIPLDTAKVRLQLQKNAVAGDVLAVPKYRGMLSTVATIAREEGVAALWKGIVPGLHRQCLFGGLRIGMYEPVGFDSYHTFSAKNQIINVPVLSF